MEELDLKVWLGGKMKITNIKNQNSAELTKLSLMDPFGKWSNPD